MFLYLFLFLSIFFEDVIAGRHNHSHHSDKNHGHGKKEVGRIHANEHFKAARESLDNHLKSRHAGVGNLKHSETDQLPKKIGRIKDHSGFSKASNH